MIDLGKVEDAWIADIEANLKAPLGLKTVVTHEPEYDNRTLQSLMPMTPFVLLRSGRFKAIEDQRKADGSSGLNESVFSIVFGATSLRDKKDARHGNYTIMKAFKERYDGGKITITGEGQINLRFVDQNFLDSEGGVIAYIQLYSYDDE